MKQSTGTFVTRGGQRYYKIAGAESLKPFFIQVASASDIWIFLSSQGGLTAGRENAEHNLFPYETEDRLHSNYDTGSRTYIRVGDKIWQPFAQHGEDSFPITQNIYKSYFGNSVILEEINEELGLSYSYCYQGSEKYGFVKTSLVENLTDSSKELEVLDGLMNIMPHGVDGNLQANASTLVDAYKAAELYGERLAVYSLTTKINDTPNPIEILKANVGFHSYPGGKVYLSPEAISAFRTGTLSSLQGDCYGKKSAYFLHYSQTLGAKDSLRYDFVLDSGFDHSMVETRYQYVSKGDFSDIQADLLRGTEELKAIVASADGIQETGDETATAHHYLNTLYNVMRGGTFETAYDFSPEDFLKFAVHRNKKALDNSALVKAIEGTTSIAELKDICAKDTLLYRLALEYLPLSFSRRHGDPSRPWNKFHIKLKGENGEKITSYEGNWRDIFQNWEALGLSFPLYYENMVAKFVNASTADGFNPYRINQEGIDWEKPEPENPFGGYGYWGDHQIVYLYRLLKGLQNHFPQKLQSLLSLEIFTYANVPYLLSSYDDILKNSKDTITFDFARDEAIDALVETQGTDGKLLQGGSGVYTCCLTEKLLVPLLSKLSNLLVGGGIWMNTQRPEWNDANNAIVGIGLSMVTVYHVKAYLVFLEELFSAVDESYPISAEVLSWLESNLEVYRNHENSYEGKEKSILDALGYGFSDYRKTLYSKGLSTKSTLSSKKILEYIACVSKAVDYTIQKNSGQVYATYNLLGEDFSVSPMVAMLEGQSAVIGSGSLKSQEVCSLLSAMKKDLLQEEQGCHTLYPIHMTKKFAEKNQLTGISQEIPGVVVKDPKGAYRFHASLVTETNLEEACGKAGLDKALTEKLLAQYETMFGHKEFTGRSQVMYKFEGIGCVYWHQNAKLALAVLETVQATRQQGEDAEAVYSAYKELMSGFIFRKTPAKCNAIPVEPYSHSSFSGQSEQAGMTGQVKESVIMRRGELGIFVKQGEIHFDKWFIPAGDFRPDGSLRSTIYTIPVMYQKDSACKEDTITVTLQSGETEVFTEGKIPAKLSEKIFLRSPEIKEITLKFS